MKTIRVSAAVIIDGSRILATERGYGEYKGGWEFPGGKREEGESGEDTVMFNPIENDRKNPIQVDNFAKYTPVFPCLSPIDTLLDR